MIADPDPLARRALREALALDPAIELVAEAPDLAGAVESAIVEQPDVVLMDADLGGADRVAEVRAIACAAPSAAIVVLSVAADDESGLGLLDAGACGYLDKATNPGSLPQALRGVAAGEAAISRQLTMRMIERMRMISLNRGGIRPVRSNLTDRQWEVIDLLQQHTEQSALAGQLGISQAAVRRHIRIVLEKLGASSIDEAIDIARRLCREPVSNRV
jgi:DNA-binding NarL/FixJ family response regulator